MATGVRCTVVSRSPCTLREASSFMQAFSTSDFLPSDGVMLSYISTVAKALRDGVAWQRQMAKGKLSLPSAEELPAGVNGVKAGMVAGGHGGQEAAGKVEAVKERQPGENGQAAGEQERKERKRKRRRESGGDELVDGGQQEKKLEWNKVGTTRVAADGEVPTAVVKDSRKKRRKERAADGGGA